MTTDQLNSEVTDAIMKAERLLKEAAEAWEKVAEIEEKLSAAETDTLCKDIATRGVWTARLRANVLAGLIPRQS